MFQTDESPNFVNESLRRTQLRFLRSILYILGSMSVPIILMLITQTPSGQPLDVLGIVQTLISAVIFGFCIYLTYTKFSTLAYVIPVAVAIFFDFTAIHSNPEPMNFVLISMWIGLPGLMISSFGNLRLMIATSVVVLGVLPFALLYEKIALDTFVYAYLPLVTTYGMLCLNCYFREYFQRGMFRQYQALVHIEKLKNLGLVSAGVVHEISNPLFIISSELELFEMDRKRNEVTNERIDTLVQRITRAHLRLREISTTLRSALRSDGHEPSGTHDLFELVSEADGLVRARAINHQIRFSSNVETGISVAGKKSELVTILLVLANNAIDAVSGSEDPWIKVNASNSNGRCRISFTDSGVPMPQKIRKQLFEPFFSTKKVESGLGIGLNMARRIAQDNGGNVWLDNDSQNTTFVVELPAVGTPTIPTNTPNMPANTTQMIT